MQIVRFNKQNVALVIGIASVLYFFLRAKMQHIEFEYEVDEKPIIVWEHVADFNNMMTLNPTILNFNIVEDKGNYKHWEYTVEYTEFLSAFPSIKNKAVGHYTVKPNGSDFVILSTHTTCFFNTYCLESSSEFKFSPAGSASSATTICKEMVTYQCPYFLGKICNAEVLHQRATIRDNLINFFKTQGRI